MTLTNLSKSIFAGLAVSMAATAYLSVEDSIVGGVLFSLGLLAIYLFDWNLYTGKCCYFVDNPKKNSPIILYAFVGNLIGILIFTYALNLAGLTVHEKALEYVQYKLSNTYIESFIRAIMCGIAMSIAVLGYKKQKDDFGRFIIVALPITVFIVAKFEHVIANFYYISLSGSWSLDSFIFILICAVGNLIGCSIIPLYNRISQIKA